MMNSICASNGRTFLNPCYFRNYNCRIGNKLKIVHHGGCRVLHENGQKRGTTGIKEQYRERCSLRVQILCASDGKSYINRCFFDNYNRLKKGNKLRIIHYGACENPTPMPTNLYSKTHPTTSLFISSTAHSHVMLNKGPFWFGATIVVVLLICTLVIIFMKLKSSHLKRDDQTDGSDRVKLDFTDSHKGPSHMATTRYEVIQPANITGESDPHVNVYEELFSPEFTAPPQDMRDFPKHLNSALPTYSRETNEDLESQPLLYGRSFGLERCPPMKGEDFTLPDFSNDFHFNKKLIQ